MKQLYPWNPILSPRSPSEIATTLAELWRDPAARRAIGDRGRAWAVEFHSIANVGAKYVREVAELAASVPARAAEQQPA